MEAGWASITCRMALRPAGRRSPAGRPLRRGVQTDRTMFVRERQRSANDRTSADRRRRKVTGRSPRVSVDLRGRCSPMCRARSYPGPSPQPNCTIGGPKRPPAGQRQCSMKLVTGWSQAGRMSRALLARCRPAELRNDGQLASSSAREGSRGVTTHQPRSGPWPRAHTRGHARSVRAPGTSHLVFVPATRAQLNPRSGSVSGGATQAT